LGPNFREENPTDEEEEESQEEKEKEITPARPKPRQTKGSLQQGSRAAAQALALFSFLAALRG
jgi:hypothetical protein